MPDANPYHSHTGNEDQSQITGGLRPRYRRTARVDLDRNPPTGVRLFSSAVRSVTGPSFGRTSPRAVPLISGAANDWVRHRSFDSYLEQTFSHCRHLVFSLEAAHHNRGMPARAIFISGSLRAASMRSAAGWRGSFQSSSKRTASYAASMNGVGRVSELRDNGISDATIDRTRLLHCDAAAARTDLRVDPGR